MEVLLFRVLKGRLKEQHVWGSRFPDTSAHSSQARERPMRSMEPHRPGVRVWSGDVLSGRSALRDAATAWPGTRETKSTGFHPLPCAARGKEALGRGLSPPF